MDIRSYGIIARIKHFLDPWSEEFIILIKNEIVSINSQCVQAMVIFDLGRNQRNINRFLAEFDLQKSKYSLTEIDNLNDIQNNFII